MRIRTITFGVKIESGREEDTLAHAGSMALALKERYEDDGWEVQSLRLATQPWETFVPHIGEGGMDYIAALEDLSKKANFDFLSIGPTYKAENIATIPEIISTCRDVCLSVDVTRNLKISPLLAQAILRTAEITNGRGNFNLAAIASVPPHTPFFPAAYHTGQSGFSIGLENGDALVLSAQGASTAKEAMENLRSILTQDYRRIEAIALDHMNNHGFRFYGIDTSLAPGMGRDYSIGMGVEDILGGTFGTPGTLGICAMITDVLRTLPVHRCGYSGLMLPVMEDVVLTERWNQGLLDVHKLLLFSSVCGTGLDTIPLPGSVTADCLSHIVTDVGRMALKLSKGLSARLMPAPGLDEGEITSFASPYLFKCAVRYP